MTNLAIYGSGGFGREVYDIATRRNAVSKYWTDIFFIDDFHKNQKNFGISCMTFEEFLYSKYKENTEVIIGIGEPSSREKIYNKLIEKQIKLTTLIDPTSIISPTAKIGKGNIICEMVTIHNQVELGENCVIQPYCDFGHNIKTGKHCVFSTHFAPGGNSIFGNKVFCGMNSASIENLTFGDNVVLAMGACCFKSIPENSVVVGNPARITKGNDDGKVFYKQANNF